MRPASENLSVGRDGYFNPGYRFPDRADSKRVGRVHGDDRRRFSQSVSFENRQPRSKKEPVDLRGERSAAGHEVAHSSAGPLLQLREDELLCESVFAGKKPTRLPAGQHDIGSLLGNVSRPEENPSLRRSTGQRILKDT